MAKKILIVESGITVIPFEETLLLRRDHDVKRAASGKQALEYFAKEKFDLLIMDDRLPDFKAEELVDKIRSEPYGKDLSIIEMSAEQERPPRGVNNLLRKPIESGEFNETCKKLLQVESRRESRLLVYVQVQGFIQSNFFLCNSRNLSSSGILILTTKHLKLGTTCSSRSPFPERRRRSRLSPGSSGRPRRSIRGSTPTACISPRSRRRTKRGSGSPQRAQGGEGLGRKPLQRKPHEILGSGFGGFLHDITHDFVGF